MDYTTKIEKRVDRENKPLSLLPIICIKFRRKINLSFTDIYNNNLYISNGILITFLYTIISAL